jgi:hypothetical protein
MRRAVLGVLVAAGLAGLFAPAALAAPVVTLTPSCDSLSSPYGVSIVLTGLPPGAQFEGTFKTENSFSFGPGFLRADQNGEFRISLGGASPLGTATASGYHDIDEDETQDPGEPSFGATLDNPCAEPPVPGGVVSGSGEFYDEHVFPTGGPLQMTVKALSGPTQQNPTGSVEFTRPSGEKLTGRVTCVSVKGALATVGVRFERTLPGGLPAALIDVLDYSNTDIQIPDRVAVTPTFAAPSQCPFPVNASGFREATGSTFTVLPAPPLLTTKAQCRQGGWQTYGIFANQRECFAYVKKQARKACYFELVAHGRPAFKAKYGIGPQRVLAMWSCVHRRTGF